MNKFPESLCTLALPTHTYTLKGMPRVGRPLNEECSQQKWYCYLMESVFSSVLIFTQRVTYIPELFSPYLTSTVNNDF